MKRALFVLAAVLAGCAAQPGGNTYNFDRFSSELPQLLETDALTVLVRGVTMDMSSHVCDRQSRDAAAKVWGAIEEWKTKNEKYTKAAGSVITAFAGRIEAARGAEAKKSYLNQTVVTTAKASEARVSSQFNGPSPENSLVPSAEACIRMAEYVRSGAADIERNPEITVALRQYMARQGMQ